MIYLLLAYISYPFVYLASMLGKKKDDGSILVFQTAKIGDMVCTTPVFREIKRAYPKIRLGVVIDPVTAPLLRYNPHIDEVIGFDKKKYKGLSGKVSFARIIKEKGYSSALILMPNAANILIPFWAGIQKRVAIYPDYAGGTLRRLLNLNTHLEYHFHPRMSMQTYLFSLRHFGIVKWSIDKEAYSAPEAAGKAARLFSGQGPFIGLALGTGNQLKDWGNHRFVSLAGMIMRETKAKLVLLGTEGDRRAAQEIADFVKDSGRVIDLSGKVPLDEGPELLKRLSLLIGVDTGLIYMADACGVPVIDIAGPCDMSDQRPTGRGSVIIQEKGFDCVPCSHTFLAPYKCRLGHRQCVIEITAEEVFKKVLEAIAGC